MCSALAHEMIVCSGVRAAALTPALLHSLASEPTTLRTLRTLDVVATGGSTLSRAYSDKIISEGGPPVQNFYGCTESWPVLQSPSPRLEPEYIAFDVRAGYAMRHYVNDLFEAVVERNDIFRDFQPAFQTYSNLRQYETGDLFSEHEELTGLWKFRGRKDDMIVLENNQNIHVSQMEAMIAQHGSIIAALIGGSGRPTPFVLVELKHGVGSSLLNNYGGVVDQLWPDIQAANALCSPNATLQKALVIIANKPLIKTTKGSVDRLRTLDLFDAQIEHAYESYVSGLSLTAGRGSAPYP